MVDTSFGPMPAATFSQTHVGANGAVSFTPIGPAQDRAVAKRSVVVEGAKTKDKYGNPAVYRNGQWVPDTSK